MKNLISIKYFVVLITFTSKSVYVYIYDILSFFICHVLKPYIEQQSTKGDKSKAKKQNIYFNC